MIVYFDLDGEFVPRNITANSKYYNGLLEGIRKDVRRKRPKNGQTVSSFIMTTLRVTHRFWYGNFCRMKTLRCVLIHLIHWTWHRANSGSSPKPKWPWKVNVLNWFRTSMQPRQRNWRQPLKMTSRTASESGKNDGINVFEARGTNCSVFYCTILFLFKHSPYFFLITPRISRRSSAVLFAISSTITGAAKLSPEVHKVAKRNTLIPSTLKMEVGSFFEIMPTMYWTTYSVTWWRVRVNIFAMETQNFLPSPVESCLRRARFGSLCTTVELQNISHCSTMKKWRWSRQVPSTRGSCLISTKSGLSRRISVKVSDIKFSEYPSNVRRADTCGQTDGFNICVNVHPWHYNINNQLDATITVYW